MNQPISSWLRRGALSLALVGLAGPSLASRTVTASDSGGPPPTTVANDALKSCGLTDFSGSADACSGFFNYGEDSNAVQSLVSGFASSSSNVAWGDSAPQTYSQASTGPTTNSLFTTAAGNDAGFIFFQRPFAGSFVLVLSGIWDDVSTTATGDQWSAYYLFDDVVASAALLQSMRYTLYGDEITTTPERDVYVMRGRTVDRVSIYQYAVPEPSSLLLSGLALGALGAAAALARRRRSPAGSAPAV
jgi:hypothetical protein